MRFGGWGGGGGDWEGGGRVRGWMGVWVGIMGLEMFDMFR